MASGSVSDYADTYSLQQNIASAERNPPELTAELLCLPVDRHHRSAVASAKASSSQGGSHQGRKRRDDCLEDSRAGSRCNINVSVLSRHQPLDIV